MRLRDVPIDFFFGGGEIFDEPDMFFPSSDSARYSFVIQGTCTIFFIHEGRALIYQRPA